MINYTDRLTLLMRDIVSRVPALSFIDMDEILVFARFGRVHTDGAFATCHCLSLPPSEPGYYFWRDRTTGVITRRSEWFITKSPVVSVGGRQMKYLISFALPRFCDQSLDRSRKERFYRRASDAWIAKLDTVIHELYHIDPEQKGIRRIERSDGTYAAHCHGPLFFTQVAQMVSEYLDTRPDPSAYDFLQPDFAALESRHNGVVATSFRSFPSYPQRFIERLEAQPACDASLDSVEVQPWREGRRREQYSEADLHTRQFTLDTSRRYAQTSVTRAA
ncbi:MAG TPA: hypothetical protein VM032_19405 [Vicinamibacterales bacterium]|nr:hypothetical protein [Vicinamibacterales bacterium]